MLRGVSATGPKERHVADLHQQVPVLDDPIADHVDHLAFALHAPFQPTIDADITVRCCASKRQIPLAMPVSSSMVMKQHAFGAARLLPDKMMPATSTWRPSRMVLQVGTRAHALSGQPRRARSLGDVRDDSCRLR
jgi:hypothetical protein